MKTTLFAGAATLMLAGAASAADLPRKTAPAAPPIARQMNAFNWTGFYVGANVGYGMGNFTGSGASNFKKPSGVLGGIQAGYNYQIGNTVLGLESDISMAHIRAGESATGVAGSKGNVDYLGTVRGRVGYSFDRFLPYVTAGYAYGGGRVIVPGQADSRPLNHGWVVGGGVEYAITNNISAKIEGLYIDLADTKVAGGARKLGNETAVVRTGINYRF